MIAFIREYLYLKKHKVPKELYRPYFRERFKANIIDLIKILCMLPQVIGVVISIFLTYFAELLLITMHCLTPQWLRLQVRVKQNAEAEKIKEYLKQKEKENADSDYTI